MTISREQQADLYPGDTLELKFNQDGAALTLRGVFPEITNFYDNYLGGPYTLTVVSRAPRLYVNHPRTEPRHRDIVLDKDGDAWQRKGNSWYFPGGTAEGASDISDCAPLRLLVDGETGQVVP